LLSQAAKHQVSDKAFSKDLLQMGIAIENANSVVKVYVESGEAILKVQK
jgi:hypothetical protein